MNISEAIEFFKNRHLSTLKHSTNMGYLLFFKNLKANFDARAVESITYNEIGQFLEAFTANVSKGTRHLRYAQTKAFFNFVINECDLNIKNPCSHAMLARHFKSPKAAARKILDKELVDELIYSTASPMFRLIKSNSTSQFCDNLHERFARSFASGSTGVWCRWHCASRRQETASRAPDRLYARLRPTTDASCL